MQRRDLPLLVIITCASPLISGCPLFSPGVTPGGQEDIASARLTIESGGVPDPDSITVDGFLSEHVIFIDSHTDAEGIFVGIDTAWHRDFDSLTPQATIQIGFGTNIDPDTFERGTLNLGLVIDRSGSMDVPLDNRTGTTKLDAVKIAVDRMLAQLTPQDLVSIVVFNEQSNTLLEAARGDDIAAIKGALDTVVPDGDTNLAAGLRRGLQTLARHTSSARLDRILVFTDAQLYSRNSQRLEDFLDVMRTYAAQDIGTTVFGVGSEFGDDVALEISQIRGGNSFFLSDFDRIVAVFDEEFDFLVAPVAYDVTLTVEVPFEFDVVDVHGLPASEPLGHLLRLTAPTLFLSPRQGGGGAFVRTRAGALVDLDQPNTVGVVTLTYTTTDGARVGSDPMPANLPAGLEPNANPSYFETEGVKRGVLLLNTVLTLKAACADVYQYGYLSLDSVSRTVAITRITEFLDYFDILAAGLEDRLSPLSRSLSEERALLVQLRTNLGG